jgi:hypothetical protein
MLGVRCIFTGKRQYPTKPAAIRAVCIAKRMKRKGDKRRQECACFHCWKCGAWHLTSKKQRYA